MNETEARARAHQLAAVRALLDEVYPDAGSTDTVTLVARLISERDDARDAIPLGERFLARRAQDERAQQVSMTARVVRGRIEGALEHLNTLILPEPDEDES